MIKKTDIIVCEGNGCAFGTLLHNIIEGCEQIFLERAASVLPKNKAKLISEIFQDFVTGKSSQSEVLTDDGFTRESIKAFIEKVYFEGCLDFYGTEEVDAYADLEFSFMVTMAKKYTDLTRDRLKALKTIRDKQLYRAKGYDDFITYCMKEQRWTISVGVLKMWVRIADAYLDSPHLDDLLMLPVATLGYSTLINKDEVFANGPKAIRWKA